MKRGYFIIIIIKWGYNRMNDSENIERKSNKTPQDMWCIKNRIVCERNESLYRTKKELTANQLPVCDDESNSSDEMKSVKALDDDDVESDDNDDNEKMRRYASTLLMLQNANPKVKRMVIHKAGKELMNCLCECGRNILKGTVPISKAQLHDLKRYEKHLRCIDKKSVSIEKKKLILQKGGFLGTFLKPLVGMLLDLTKWRKKCFW